MKTTLLIIIIIAVIIIMILLILQMFKQDEWVGWVVMILIILQMLKRDGGLVRKEKVEKRWHCGAMCRQNKVKSFHDYQASS